MKTLMFILMVGSYASADKPGIYHYQFDADSGELSKVAEFAGVSNPSYLAWSSSAAFYAVSENKGEQAAANAFGSQERNSQPVNGDEPCYINIAPNKKFAVTANYGGGSVSVLPINKDGSLSAVSQVFTFSGSSVNADRQRSPHLHSAVFSPDGKYMFACDLGTDQIYRFTVSDEGLTLSGSIPTKAGSGPRHMEFSTSGFAYTTHEMTAEVGVWRYADGQLTLQQMIAADDGDGEKSGADLHLTSDGKFLYASNRAKTNNLAIFRIAADGTLTLTGRQPTGKCPRNFAISPDDKWLLVACQNDNLIQVFARDPADGQLRDTGKTVTVSAPVCLKFR